MKPYLTHACVIFWLRYSLSNREQVEKVAPQLVVHDKEGKPYTVRYDAVNAMLLNEFLKEHRRVRQLEANALEQQKQIDALTALVRKVSAQRIEALTAGRQKVSARLEASKPAPRLVTN